MFLHFFFLHGTIRVHDLHGIKFCQFISSFAIFQAMSWGTWLQIEGGAFAHMKLEFDPSLQNTKILWERGWPV